MNNKNIILSLIAFMLIVIIGGMGYWWYNYGYIKSVKPYTDPYKDYSEAELVKMQGKGDLDAKQSLETKLLTKENIIKLIPCISKLQRKITQEAKMDLDFITIIWTNTKKVASGLKRLQSKTTYQA